MPDAIRSRSSPRNDAIANAAAAFCALCAPGSAIASAMMQDRARKHRATRRPGEHARRARPGPSRTRGRSFAGRASSQSAMAREPASSTPITARSSLVWRSKIARFASRVTGHVAMAIDMVRAEIEHCRRIEANGRESLQHVGRHFQHIDAVVRQQRQRQRGGTKVGARLGVPSGLLQDMRQQRRRGRFAVGAGDPDKPRAAIPRGERPDTTAPHPKRSECRRRWRARRSDAASAGDAEYRETARRRRN